MVEVEASSSHLFLFSGKYITFSGGDLRGYVIHEISSMLHSIFFLSQT